jgi:hypothetical protein
MQEFAVIAFRVGEYGKRKAVENLATWKDRPDIDSYTRRDY